MQIEQLTRIDQIEEGDGLIIADGAMLIMTTAKRVKVSEYDGTEVIFDEKHNKFFNVGMYLDRKSWAKDVRIVRMTPSNADVGDLKRDGLIAEQNQPYPWLRYALTDAGRALLRPLQRLRLDRGLGVSPLRERLTLKGEEMEQETERLRLLERKLAAIVGWLEANQPDVFKRGLWDAINKAEWPRFANVSCSQCGQEFGPGDHGFSHCEHHRNVTANTK